MAINACNGDLSTATASLLISITVQSTRTASVILTYLKRATRELPKGGNVEFVMFEDVDGLEVFVNPDRVVWVREYPNQTTVISCGHEDKFAVRLAPAHAVAALGKSAR
ncbi:MAG: hypothetical protein WB562_04510 [Candidatus Sulfotelmatobacter sp.]